MSAPQPDRADRVYWEGGVVFGAALLLYVATAAPDIVGHDAGELQFVPYILGIAHHTGYPLYTLLGKLWTLVVPVGNVAYRMNLLSAVCSAAAVALAYGTMRRLGASVGPSAVGALALAVAPSPWRYATVAGVRAMSAFFVALVLFAAAGWQREVRARGAVASGGLVAVAAAFGFGLTHHRSILFMAPALALFVIAVGGRSMLRWRNVVMVSLALALPQLLYVYLPLRAWFGAPYAQFSPDTWEGFRDLVIAGYETSVLLYSPPEGWGVRLVLLGSEAIAELGWLGLGMGAVGLGWLLWRQRSFLLLVAVFSVGLAVFTMAWNIGVGRLNVPFLLPLWFVGWIVAGFGIEVVLAIAQRWRGVAATALSVAIVGAAVIAIVVAAGDRYQQRADLAAAPLDAYRQRLDDGLRARRLVMTSLPLMAPDGVLVAEWEQTTAYWDVQRVERLNYAVQVEYPLSNLGRVLAEADARPVYVVARDDLLMGRTLTMRGSAIEALRQPDTVVPDDLQGPSFDFDDEIRLLGYRTWNEWGEPTASLAMSDVLPIAVTWAAMRPPRADYSVSLRLLDEAGRTVAQSDQAHPVLGLSPTHTWRAGQVVSDYYELPVRRLSAGRYRLAVILYRAEGGRFYNLPVVDQDGHLLGEVAVIGEVLVK